MELINKIFIYTRTVVGRAHTFENDWAQSSQVGMAVHSWTVSSLTVTVPNFVASRQLIWVYKGGPIRSNNSKLKSILNTELKYFTLSMFIPWYSMSCIAWRLKLSSTLVYGHKSRCTAITKDNPTVNILIFIYNNNKLSYCWQTAWCV